MKEDGVSGKGGIKNKTEKTTQIPGDVNRVHIYTCEMSWREGGASRILSQMSKETGESGRRTQFILHLFISRAHCSPVSCLETSYQMLIKFLLPKKQLQYQQSAGEYGLQILGLKIKLNTCTFYLLSKNKGRDYTQ